MHFNLINKLLESSTHTMNLIFIGVMIGGSILILGSLYLIYDVQVFGERHSTKTDLMMISITFTVIHIALTNASLFVFKKMRYAKTLIQKEKEEIKKIDKAKDEFAAMIAHELKNPLVPIHSYSRMLLDGRFGELTSTQKEKMKIVISGTESMLFLIQDILDNHKAELRKLNLNLQDTDLNEIVNDVVSITQTLADKRGVTIYNDINKSVKTNVDKHRIEQVLTNLIKNAIDFVPKETGVIKISLKLEDRDAIISVIDNGCGIPKEKISHLFGKFYQVNTSQVRERSGSGLGLAICKSIIELHNGKIWAESDVGKGTAIRFTIPLTNNIYEKRKNLVEKTL
ncbi:MAG: sensor histidine kinase [Candidatus Nitrosotenuis sp.]